ncbi:MAG: hypothetical protein FWG90_09555 [Oscillospiraceae bacterium]|nr:hypothetical protein [Oscillospiraceae bacterium]
MRNILKASLILPIVLLLNLELLISPMIRHEWGAVELFMRFFCKSDDLTRMGVLAVFLSVFPLLIFVIIFGTFVYSDLTVSSIYLFSRQASRGGWYLKTVLRLGIYAAVSSLWFSLACRYLVYGFTGGEYRFEITAKLFIMSFAITFGFALLQNIISIAIGTTYGFFATYALILISIGAAIQTLKTNTTSLLARIFNPFYSLILAAFNELTIPQLFISFLPVGVILICGFSAVKYSDIGLSNKELI